MTHSFQPTIKQIKGMTDLKPLARGGMAEVYTARRKADGLKVAIKVLTEEALDNPTFLGRFERESDTLLQMDHPHIVRGYEVGMVDDRPYLVMEFVPGINAMDLILRDGPLPVETALYLLGQVVDALGYAHGKGYVHRDVKPSNILLEKNMNAKLSDFGLAKLEGDFSVTIDGSVLGTPHYLAPEQISGAPHVDHRADIYSLGMTLYFLVVGEPALQAASLPAVLTRHLTDEVSFSPSLRELLPEPIIVLIRRMTAKSPERRYQSIAELQQDLAWASGEGEGPLQPLNDAVHDYYVQDWEQVRMPDCDDNDDAHCQEVPDEPDLLVDVPAGAVLAYEDENIDAVYWLVSGEVELIRGGRRIAVIRERGTVLGELAVLRRTKRAVTVRALTPCKLLKVEAKQFTQFLTEHPAVMRDVLREMADRVDALNKRMAQSIDTLASLRRTMRTIADGVSQGDLTPEEAAMLLRELALGDS